MGQWTMTATVAFWMFLGAAIMALIWVVFILIPLRRIDRELRELENQNEYAFLLGKPCWYRFNEKCSWHKYRIVAVSHKGSISIRLWDDNSGKHAFWVNHVQVAEKVQFEDPEGGR